MKFLFQRLAGTLDGKRKTAALILAAGKSSRMGSKESKQFLTVGGIPVLAHTLIAYEKAGTIQQIIVAARPEDFPLIQKIKKDYQITKLSHIISGGKNRQESAQHALTKVQADVSFVAIADGARCLTTPEEIVRVCSKAYTTNAASAACPVTGTLKKVDLSLSVKNTVPRDDLWEAQTPQVFHLALYTAALERAISDQFVATDDNSIVEHYGCTVQLIPCSPENLKVTTPQDLRMARAIYTYRKALEGKDAENE